MSSEPEPESKDEAGVPAGIPPEFFCPRCNRPVPRPLVCGDCSALLCRECGSPLERVDDLGLG